MQKILFLDRDGVINKDIGYAHKKEQIEFVEGIFDFCNQAIIFGYQIIIVTNQSGIARGYYSYDDFHILMKWIILEFKKHDIAILDYFYCPHHPLDNCNCRKPNPGMILDAVKKYPIDLSNSIMVGDKESDLIAAKKAGIGRYLYISEIKNLAFLDD